MSEELVANDTIQGRSYRPPVPLSANFEGIFRLPPGTILDVRPGRFLFNGSLLDNAPNNNIIQGATWTDFSVNTVTNSSPVTVLASYGNIVDSVSDGVIFGSRGCSVLGSPTAVQKTIDWYLIGCGACQMNLQGSSVQCGIIGSALSTISTAAPTAPATQNRVVDVGLEQCINCTIDSTGPNSIPLPTQISTSFIKASQNCNIRTLAATNCQRTSIQTSVNCNVHDSITTGLISSNNFTANSCATVHTICANGGSATSSSVSLLGGSNPSITGLSNCFVWGSTSPTASNQAAFGTDILVRNNRDLTVETGYVNSAQGHVTSYREVTTGTSTLLVTDGTVKLSPGTTLTLPLASAMAANYPLTTSRTWTIIADPITALVTTPPVMNRTSPDLINNKTNWTSHVFKAPGQRIRLTLVNRAGFTGWYISDDVEYNSFIWTAINNNFGVAPPQSDANQLTTSTSQATHQALGAASYVTFENLQQNSSNLASLTTPGFATNITAGMSITYGFDIFFSANAAGGYLVRADLVNTTTGVSVPGSYTEANGNNGREGSKRVTVVCRGAVGLNVNNFQLRISRDTTDVISPLASIRNVSINIDAGV